MRAHPTSSPRANLTLWSAFALIWIVIVAAAIAGASPKHKSADQPAALPAVGSTELATTPSNSATSSTPVATPTPASTTATATASPTTVETTGGSTTNSAGAVLPDPKRTPGATNPAVTQATISTTICVSGWTATVRPSSTYTTALKERQLASGYAYQRDLNTADYEEDHLISLEIGGSPASELNLWPEPYHTPDGARVKDVIENKLHAMVCAGALTLATAQHAIATNWWSAYLNYVGTQPSTSSAAPPPVVHTTSAPPATALSCSASMSNSSPAQYATVDVIVRTSAGANVTATAHYKSTNTTHASTAGSTGTATIAFAISRATVGYTVEVDVTVAHTGASASCSTSFTPT